MQARPFVRWWWNGNCVNAQEIRRELEVMKEAGIGGVEINPIRMPPGSKKTYDKALVWLSDDWNKVLKQATEDVKQKGMIADLIVGTGWPFGGKFLKAGQVSQGLKLQMLRPSSALTLGTALWPNSPMLTASYQGLKVTVS